VADLPGPVPLPVPPAKVPPKDVVRVRRIGGNVKYEGAWLVPRRLEAEVRGGNLRLLVPAGWDVDANEVEIRGGNVVVRHAKDLPADVPVVHGVVVTGELTGGIVVILPPRRPRGPSAPDAGPRRQGRLRGVSAVRAAARGGGRVPPRQRSASTSRAARAPEASAPWTEPVARWSPHT
jgi:hypothetical protein